MSLHTLSKYKYSPTELTESSVNNEQLSQIQYDGWVLAGHDKPYKVDKEYLKKYGIKKPGGDKSTCGEWVYYGCKNDQGHTNNLLTNNTNPVFIKPTKFNCNRLRCSECYTRAAFSRSVKINKRIKYFQQTEGYYNSPDKLIETHVIVSPRIEIQDTYESIRSKVVKLLLDVGVVGGVLVVHHFRCDDYSNYKNRGLHFHCVGYAPDAFIDGVEVARQFKKHHFAIVKNKGARKSVRKTVSYLLGHCSVKKGKHSITWFGKLSYSNMKYHMSRVDLDDLEKIRCCPVCQESLVRLDYIGLDRPPTELSFGKISDWILK